MADRDNLTNPQIVVPTPKTRHYRTFLIKLGRKLKKADLSELKFALRGTIPEGKLENLNDPLQLFIALEHLCLLGPDNFSTLRGYLKDIDRPNLVQMLDEYGSSRGELVEVTSNLKLASDAESQVTSGSKDGSEVGYNQMEEYYPVDKYPTHYTNYTDPVINLKAQIKETEDLIKRYIGFRSGFLQSCLDGIPREILVPTSKRWEKVNVLRRLAMDVEGEYKVLFQLIPSLLDFSESRAEITFNDVAKGMFSDNVVNWGRIGVLITFTGVVAHHFVEQERPEMVCEVIQWLLQFIRIHLINWIIQHGGWDGFVEHFNRSKPPKSFWTGVFTMGAVGVAGITLPAMSNK